MGTKKTKVARSREQKMLKGFAVIALLGAALYLCATAICGVGSLSMENMGLAEYNAMIAESGGEAISAQEFTEAQEAFDVGFALCGLYFILSLLMGITGIKAARKPRKAKAFIVVTAIFLVVSALSFVMEASDGLLPSMSLIATSLAELAFLAFALYVAIRIKKGYEEGSIFEDVDSEKSDLGFIAVIQGLMFLSVTMSIISLMFSLKSDVTFNFYTVLELGNVIFYGVTIWLIHQRSKFTRTWVIGFCALDIVCCTAYMALANDLTWAGVLESQIINIFMIVYFAFAKRPRLALTQDFDLQLAEKEHEQDKALWSPKTWPFWRNLAMFYCLFSIVGHWMEAAYCTGIRFGLFPGIYDPTSQIWSDWLYPFPVYGVGFVACGLLLFPIKNWLQDHLPRNWQALLASFVVNTVVCAVIELILGLTTNQPVNGVYPLWDYSNMFMNFMGQICLLNSCLFGAVATLCTWVAYPVLSRLLKRLSKDMGNMLFVIVIVFYAMVMSLYYINLAI